MQEDVCILLNEREQLKQQMAAELEHQLSLRRISCSRLQPSTKLAKIVFQRSPHILILDYILGDVGTALDILTEINLSQDLNFIKPIIWTDEQSIQVAVTALKLGAADYIELSSPQSLERVLSAIESNLKSIPQNSSKQLFNQPFYEKPIGQSRDFLSALTQAESIAKRNSPIVILLGEPGSGRSTLAQHIHHCRENPGPLVEIDFSTWPHKIENIYGNPANNRIVPLLSFSATVFLKHVEFDTGELIEGIESRRNFIWKQNEDFLPPTLILGTTSTQCANTWSRLLEAEIIAIPTLEQRRDDFIPLVYRFLSRAQQGTKLGKSIISSSIVQQLVEMDWPGNVKELRAVILEIAFLPLQNLSKELESPQDELIIQLILEAKTRWEQYHQYQPFYPEPLVARRILDEVGGNLRLAAARLGTGISQIRSVLTQDGTDQNKIC